MRVCLISRCRDERNVQEWIDYHLQIGFTDIFIYDDFSTPPVSQIIQPHEHVHVVRLARRINIHPVHGGAGHGYHEMFLKIAELKLDYDYILDIDTDEYLYLDQHQSVQELIKAFMPFDLLLLNFLFMGNNGRVKREKDGVLNEFNQSCDKFQDWGKTLAKYSSIVKEKYSPHLFEKLNPSPFVICKNINNELVPNNQPIPGLAKTNAQIVIENQEMKKAPPCVFHYCVQDVETYLSGKVNKKEFRVINGQHVEIDGFERKFISFDLDNMKDTDDFLKQLDEKGYNTTLKYYQKNCQNVVTNNLLFNRHE